MNAPTLWQMVILALLFLASIPYILVLLAKLRILPLTVLLLIIDSFDQWAAENSSLCIILFILFVLYPILTVVMKTVRWRREELEARNYLLRTARPLSRVPDCDYDADMDW